MPNTSSGAAQKRKKKKKIDDSRQKGTVPFDYPRVPKSKGNMKEHY